jgi:hypothetical protein
VNVAFDHHTGDSDAIPSIAKRFKARKEPWALIVDENYGEGSAREHAALQPRFYGMFSAHELINPRSEPPNARLLARCCKVVCSYPRDKSEGIWLSSVSTVQEI